jgi:hypothetical protein
MYGGKNEWTKERTIEERKGKKERMNEW